MTEIIGHLTEKHKPSGLGKVKHRWFSHPLLPRLRIERHMGR